MKHLAKSLLKHLKSLGRKATMKLKKEEVKGIRVQQNDGSVWEATVNDDGSVELTKQISPPKSRPEPAKVAEEDGEDTPTLDDLLKGMARVESMGGKEASHKEHKREDQPKEVDPIPDDVKERLKDHAFRARLSSVMLDNKYDRMLRGRTRGKLDMSRLYKVPTQARNVFKQKQARRGKQYNIMLVVDESGSMVGAKARQAAECTVFLAKQFEGININVAIIGFNSLITTRKEFTKPADYDRIYQAISTMNFRNGHGYNNDWDALNKAYQMFDHAPEGENILIMLSDGEPASDSDELEFIDINGKHEEPPKGTDKLDEDEKDEKEHIHHLVKANDHRVKSIGIGIQEGGWQIPDHEVVKNLNQLKPAIIKQLKKHIRRG